MYDDRDGRDERNDRRRLSTGQAVHLPLRCRADVAGVTLTADHTRVRAAVPDGLTPVRVSPGTALVTLLAVDYRSVGDLDPYDEFAVGVPVATRSVRGVPTAGIGGYVHALPVTTDAARALGVEVWGYPKWVTDVDVCAARDGTRMRAVVDAADGPRVSLTVDVDDAVSLLAGDGDARASDDGDSQGSDDELSHTLARAALGAPTAVDGSLRSYTATEGRVHRVRVDVSGAIRVGLGGAGVHLSLGGGRTAGAIRDLGIGGRVLGRVVATGVEARIHPATTVGGAK